MLRNTDSEGGVDCINHDIPPLYVLAQDLELRVTRGPHETQRKVSRAALKKFKKLPSKF